MFKNYSKVLLKMVEKAVAKGEVPVACIAVLNGQIIARAYNLVERRMDKMAHAEMLVLEKLRKKFKTTHFFGMELSLYVTLEPCCMCATAISMCGVKNVFYMAEEQKFGGIERIYTGKSAYFKPNFFFVESKEYQLLISSFFVGVRE